MKKIFFAIAILGLISIGTINAQSVFTGTIEYEITYPNSNLDPMMVAYLPSSTILTFGETKCKVLQATSAYSSVIMVDATENTFCVLISAMGQKFMAKETIKQEELNTNKPKMIPLNETKTIAGYLCTKTEVIIGEGEETVSYFGYFNKDVFNPTYSMADQLGIDGIPLEIEIDLGEMTMKMVAKKVKQSKIKDSEFAIPEGYTEVSMDALRGLGM